MIQSYYFDKDIGKLLERLDEIWKVDLKIIQLPIYLEIFCEQSVWQLEK